MPSLRTPWPAGPADRAARLVPQGTKRPAAAGRGGQGKLGIPSGQSGVALASSVAATCGRKGRSSKQVCATVACQGPAAVAFAPLLLWQPCWSAWHRITAGTSPCCHCQPTCVCPASMQRAKAAVQVPTAVERYLCTYRPAATLSSAVEGRKEEQRWELQHASAGFDRCLRACAGLRPAYCMQLRAGVWKCGDSPRAGLTSGTVSG